MRSKEWDDALVLGVLAKAAEALNKEQIERRAKEFTRELERATRKETPQPVSHRAIREAIERLEEGGEIIARPLGPGRAPHTQSFAYELTELGKAALRREPKQSSYRIDVERARQIVEAEEEKKWSPLANRAYCEMLIAYAWLVGRLGGLLPVAFSEAKSSRQAEKRARPISNILLPDLMRVVRACYRHHDVKAGDMPVLDYVTISDVGEGTVDEQSEIWLKEYAPDAVRKYAGWVPDDHIALTWLFSKNERQVLRALENEKMEIARQMRPQA